MSASAVSASTTLPFPSSPHWTPTTAIEGIVRSLRAEGLPRPPRPFGPHPLAERGFTPLPAHARRVPHPNSDHSSNLTSEALHPVVEEVAAVVRPRRRLRVELHRGDAHL